MRTVAPPRGLVLAAGGSRRLGRAKQSLEIDGIPLLRRTVLRVAGVCRPPVVVVTGAGARQAAGCLDGLDVTVARNRRWREGLSTSLAAGLDALGTGCGAALVTPCDLPGLSQDDLERLVEAWRAVPENPAAAAYDGVIGSPAILPERFFAELAGVGGDRGAREFLRRGDVPVTVVRFPSAAGDLDHDGHLAALADGPGDSVLPEQ